MPPRKEKANMNARITRPTTAIRLRKNRLATMAPGESTLTRRSSLSEYCSSPESTGLFVLLSSDISVFLLS